VNWDVFISVVRSEEEAPRPICKEPREFPDQERGALFADLCDEGVLRVIGERLVTVRVPADPGVGTARGVMPDAGRIFELST